MSSKRQPQILLVEDDPKVYLTLQRRLTGEGYVVTLAPNYAEARIQLDLKHFHLAIIDVCLDPDDDSDRSGIRLMKDVYELGLRDVMPCIIVTAYGTKAMVLQMLQNLGAARFIEKEAYYLTPLFDAIREILGEYKISFSLEYVADTRQRLEQGARYIWAHEANWPAPERLVQEIEDLLGKLLYGARSLWIDRTFAGLSGSFVMEAHPSWAVNLGQSVIIKVGRRSKTKVEETNYHDFVHGILMGRYATQLSAAYTRHLGALLYTFIDVEVENTIDFKGFYQHHAPASIIEALHRLFTVTCRRWYQDRQQPQYQNLRDLYWGAFNLQQQPDRLANEIASFYLDYDPHTPEISFAAPALTLPNPLYWLERDVATVMPVCYCVTHGDLNSDNILMNENGDCWLIDFYRTGSSHILRDFIELESDIKFRLMDTLSPEDFYRFEQALIHFEHPDQGAIVLAFMSDDAQKAASVISGLRAEAWHLLTAIQPNTRMLQREYLTGLLMGTLNILRLRHFKTDPKLQPRRELALLSAALICQYLQ
jgi:CheY-like chemotaxis protein